MATIADIKEHLDQFPDDLEIVFRADTERELYDEIATQDIWETLDFEFRDLALASDVDYWEPAGPGNCDAPQLPALVWMGRKSQ